jgi:hypothetical protein
MAVIIARAGVLVKVAILFARRVVLSGNSTEIGVLSVVAGAQAFGIFRVNQAVRVIVEAVTAGVDLSAAGRNDAGELCVGIRRDLSAAASGRVRRAFWVVIP